MCPTVAIVLCATLSLVHTKRVSQAWSEERYPERCSQFRYGEICTGTSEQAAKSSTQTECATFCKDLTRRKQESVCCTSSTDGACKAYIGGTRSSSNTSSSALICTFGHNVSWMHYEMSPRAKFLLSEQQRVARGDDRYEQSIQLEAESDFEDPALFRSIMPSDAMQGQTGDCWAVAAIASMARFPNAIRRLFHQQMLSHDGIYHLQLFDARAKRWKRIAVNDEVPVIADSKRPKYMKKTRMNEIWPMLLEKGLAKVMSSFHTGESGYADLSLGLPSWAFTALTGGTEQWMYRWSDHAKASMHTIGGWFKSRNEVHTGNLALGAVRGSGLKGSEQDKNRFPLRSEDLLHDMKKAMDNNFLMAGSVDSMRGSEDGGSNGANGEQKRTDGLFKGHAYSILSVETFVKGTPHKVCVESVKVIYTGLEQDFDKDKARVDYETMRFRGWAPGDVVWAYLYFFANRSDVPSRCTVSHFDGTNVSCRGEQCVQLTCDTMGSNLVNVPFSWVLGRRQWGVAERHGVRPGWKLLPEKTRQVLEFEGIVDRSVCEDPGTRQVRTDTRPIDTLDLYLGSWLTELVLVHVRNPWGNHKTYNGPWSDGDIETWNQHPDIKEALAFDPTPDGTFWIDFKDFQDKFDGVFISSVNMAEFDPIPPECNTNWGSTVFVEDTESTPLSWPKGHQPAPDQCSYCTWRDRGITDGVKCSDAWGEGAAEGVQTHSAKQADKKVKVCCKMVAHRLDVKD